MNLINLINLINLTSLSKFKIQQISFLFEYFHATKECRHHVGHTRLLSTLLSRMITRPNLVTKDR